MTKIYLIIYLGSRVFGFVGPLPDDMPDCQRKAELVNIEYQKSVTRYHDAGDTFRENLARQMVFECEYRTELPVIGEKGRSL